MTRRMLINAVHPEECRVAVIDDGRLIELEIERAGFTQLKGNIYKAAITRIEPSLQAAFLDIDANRNGFLQINDINPAYFGNWPPADAAEARRRPSIQDVLRPGQELIVQVVKDERAAKGATLTTNLSIPGRYLVLMVGNQRGGVSRKISDEGQRVRLRQVVQNLRLPAGMGVIVRTAGINKGSAELQRDLDGLLEIWFEILTRSYERGAPLLLYRESNLAVRTIRDYLTPDIEEIVIDEKETYEKACSFVNKIVPSFAPKVRFFEGPQPLFSKYNLDSQVEETEQTEVTLPSGGSLVINVTEAVVAIDVNSGRATSQADVEETAFQTNREAAEVIARQLRLRDLGGLIVIDFIDMIDRRHKLIVEKHLRDAVKRDKAKIEIGRISKFGLLELSRQRLKTSLVSHGNSVCPHCDGRGRVKTVEAAALEALRKIQSSVFAGGVSELRVRMAPAAALLLLNEKRQILASYEKQTGTTILVYADGRMKPEQYEVELVTGKSHEEPRVALRDPAAEPSGPRSEGTVNQERTEDERQTQHSRSRHKNNQWGQRRNRNDSRGQHNSRYSRDRGRSRRQGGRDRSGPPHGGSPRSSARREDYDAPKPNDAPAAPDGPALKGSGEEGDV